MPNSQQLALDFTEAGSDRDDGFPCADGRWLHISTPKASGYASMTIKHRSFESAIIRALTLLNESPAFYESIEVRLDRDRLS